MGLFDKLKFGKRKQPADKKAEVSGVAGSGSAGKAEKSGAEIQPAAAKALAGKQTKPAKPTKEKKDKSGKGGSKKAKDDKKAEEGIFAAKTLKSAHKIIIHPVLSEKSFRLQADTKYIFVVAKDANKHQIKQAMKELYGIKPVKVNIIKKKPGIKYKWGKKTGTTPGAKRAIVTMPPGTVLNLTE